MYKANDLKRGVSLEKRSVTIQIGGQPCRFFSDDSEEYLSALEERANAVMRETARFSGPSNRANAILAVLSLTDTLLRTEQKAAETASEPEKTEGRRPPARKTPERNTATEKGQLSVWDLLEGKPGKPETDT